MRSGRSELATALRRDAPSKRGRLFQADAFSERVGVPMCQPPIAPFAAKDQSDAQRPFLGRQTAHRDEAAFDDR